MARTTLALGLATFGMVAAGCTAADLAFIGMGNTPRETEVVRVGEPLQIEVERPKGEAPKAAPEAGADEFRVPVPRDAPFGYVQRGERAFGRLQNGQRAFGGPWSRPVVFGLHAGDPDDLRWSVRGAGRGGFGIPGDPPPALSFGTDPVPAQPATPVPPSPEQPKFSDR